MLLKHLTKIIFFSDLHATRVLLGIAELIWAIALFWPGDTFSRPTYIGMAHIMKEELWAVLFTISSIIQFKIVVDQNYHSKFATSFALLNSILWWFCVISMYLSVYPPPAAISGETALAIGASWVFIRSGYKTKRNH